MRVKDSYSLIVDEIIDEVPQAENLPARFDGGINIAVVYGNYLDSLDIFEAFGNYLVERNRTKDLAKQIAAAESALDARNDEARRQNEIIIANYAERIKAFLKTKRQELESETQRIELESAAQVEQLQNDREREHAGLNELIELLKYYQSSLDTTQKILADFEADAEKFMTRNKFYYQVKEDYRIKIKWITNLLKQIDG